MAAATAARRIDGRSLEDQGPAGRIQALEGVLQLRRPMRGREEAPHSGQGVEAALEGMTLGWPRRAEVLGEAAFDPGNERPRS